MSILDVFIKCDPCCLECVWIVNSLVPSPLPESQLEKAQSGNYCQLCTKLTADKVAKAYIAEPS